MALIYYVTQIQFDFGAIKLLKQECERVGISRPLIVTDPGVKAAGILQQFELEMGLSSPVKTADSTSTPSVGARVNEKQGT